MGAHIVFTEGQDNVPKPLALGHDRRQERPHMALQASSQCRAGFFLLVSVSEGGRGLNFVTTARAAFQFFAAITLQEGTAGRHWGWHGLGDREGEVERTLS